MEIDYEKEIRDILHKISPEKKIEDFFSENFPTQWNKIPKKEKDLYVSKTLKFISSKEKMAAVENLVKRSENLENKRSDIIFLFLGVILGVSGNIVANLIDKYLSHFGHTYNIVAIIIFLASFWFIYYVFINKTSKKIATEQNSIELLKIVGAVENYK